MERRPVNAGDTAEVGRSDDARPAGVGLYDDDDEDTESGGS